MGRSTSAIYSAPWVLPMANPPVREGAIAVKDGCIEAVGPASEIRTAFPGRREVTCQGVLMPALINAHIHLELSHLPDIKRPAAGWTMCDWIEDLIQARGECKLIRQEIELCRQRVLLDQYRSGVVLLADIGNEPYSLGFSPAGFPLVLHFQEFLAPTGSATEVAMTSIAALPDSVAATAHAVYSTSPELIRQLKNRARRLDRVFPIHVSESKEEIQFIQSATGSFRDFLVQRGAWDGTFSEGRNDLEGSVMYLQQLGVLDTQTLCVHCVHVTENEVQLLVENDAHVCLCPGSNRFLRVGMAPVEHMLRYGLLPAIGTDSIASNETLDIWREMQILREDHPHVNPTRILEMATLGGAAALHYDRDFGSLAPGRRAIFLEVDAEGFAQIDSEYALFDILTKEGRPRVVSWIDASDIPRSLSTENDWQAKM
jgi:aminodeoxyfutalosine deaminase